MIDKLEALAVEYRIAKGEEKRQQDAALYAKRLLSEKGQALIEAIAEAGLAEYGPITSRMERRPTVFEPDRWVRVWGERVEASPPVADFSIRGGHSR